MAYTKPTLVGYNASPPTDDGAQTAENRVDWAKHINKIGDPLRTYVDAINDAAEDAFLLSDPLTKTVWTPDAFSGFTANPATTFRYKLDSVPLFGSGVVTMRTGAISYGTTNGGGISFGTMPEAIRPSADRTVAIPVLVQTGGFGVQKALALAVITTAGGIQIWMQVSMIDTQQSQQSGQYVTWSRYIFDAPGSSAFSLEPGANFSYEL